MHKPRFLTRFFFWLLLGLLSTFFAEFMSGSAPDFLLIPFGYLGIIPIYCLHTLLLASLVIRPARPFSLRTLYFASLLFGMYEAYITKVLWEPHWNPDAFRIANIAVFETVLLVLFWHAVFSFILPLFVSEYLLTDSYHLHRLLPEKWQVRVGKTKTAIFFGLIASALFAIAANTPGEAGKLAILNCSVASLAILAWRIFTRRQQYDLADLLPRKFALGAAAILLLLVYLYLGFTINRQVHPGVAGHAAVLLMYFFIIILNAISARRDASIAVQNEADIATPRSPFEMKNWFVFCGALVAGSILINLLPQAIQDLLSGGLFVTYFGMGVFLLVRSIRSLFSRRPAENEPV